MPIEHRSALTRLHHHVPLPPPFVAPDEIHRCCLKRWVWFRSHSPFSFELPPPPSYFHDNTVSQLTQLPITREVGRRCSFEAGSVHIVHFLALVFPRADNPLVLMNPYPPVPTPASEKTCRPSYTPRSIPVQPSKARPLVFSLIPAYTRQVSYKIHVQTQRLRPPSFRVFRRGRAASRGLYGSDVATANAQDGGDAVVIGTVWRRYVGVVFV